MATQSDGHQRGVTLIKGGTVPDKPNDSLQIVGARASVGFPGAFLLVDVSYGGGMAEHGFQAYWNGASTRSDPAHITIELRHDDKGDPGKAIVNETLRIDVAEPFRELGRFIAVVRTAGPDSEPVLVESTH